MAIELRGQRILLRPLKLTDAEAIYRHARHREISRYTYIPHPYRREHADQFINMTQVWLKKGVARHFGIDWKETREVIGVIGLFDIDMRNKRTEIGYWLGKKYWGMGIASEAVSLVVDYCFKTLKLHRVYAHVFTGNTASERLLLRLGFQYEGMERESRRCRGRYKDSHLYAVLKGKFRMTRNSAISSHSGSRMKK